MQFGVKSYALVRDFKIERACSASLILNHKYDFIDK